MEGIKKTTLYVGLNDKDTKTQKIDTLEAVKIVTNLITAKCDGGTIYNATGIYKHDDGTIVIENTLRIELIDTPEDILSDLIDTLKNVLNQESIIKQTEIVNSIFC